MNKKGFTLVELLAVIAILAILVIIALPNVIKLYNDAKKNSFLTEAKTIYKEAANKYITESMKGNKVNYISSTKNSLELNGSKDIEYKISLNNDGSIRRFQVKNNSYCINGKYNDANELIIDDVTEKECAEIDATYCKSNLSSLSTGSEVIIGKYTYRYNQSYDNDKWNDFSQYATKGWGVILTDKDSTEAITEVPCTFIDNIPIVNMTNTYSYSKAKSIDLSNINTSRVNTMSSLFRSAEAESINIIDLDTSNIGSTFFMFNGIKAKSLDLSSMDTSKVRHMSGMFMYSAPTTLDVSSFDTKNVSDMQSMFSGSQAVEIKGLENFDTTSLTFTLNMFHSCSAKTLDLSSFDTSKVTNMNNMFTNSHAEIVYTRNDEELNKYKSISNVPSQIKFINKNSNK